MTIDKCKELELITINDLLNENFYIPAYQRGYRWKKEQVQVLLDDIWDFKENPPFHEEGKKKPFYCLQPIVVKSQKWVQKNDDDSTEEVNGWEVIDAQQRLTTILIILHYFNETEFKEPKPLFKLYYETRNDNKPANYFLKSIKSRAFANGTIDHFHINAAYVIVENWFNQKMKSNAAIRGDFYTTLINSVKFICYKVEEDSDNNSNSIDIFTRLNIGKISLTNAELIKALFLQRGNFDKDKVNLKQIQIASEWDIIERTLQNDSFWYFIYNPKNPLKYDTRIEYIFDLMKVKEKENENHFTFYEFNKDFIISKKNNNNKPNIDAIWKKIKKYFQTFESWYNNHELYHLVGFLVECGIKINELKEASESKTKTDFKTYLISEIKNKINCSLDDLNQLEYKDKRTKMILLLFNIQTILSSKNTDMRFPFDKFKNQKNGWDVEHIRSQTGKLIVGENRRAWAKDILEYFTGIKDFCRLKKEKQEEILEKLTEKEKGYSEKLIGIINNKIDNLKFDDLYRELTSYFKENTETENTDCISNLALLDATTNRSYKNAMFPIKRKTIIENDMKGIFVPICTKNVFLKSYSKKMGDVMYWKENDADDYLNAIKEILKDYLKQPENNNE